MDLFGFFHADRNSKKKYFAKKDFATFSQASQIYSKSLEVSLVR